ncbi:DoxX family membrane protein [Naumannella huperziae]
MLRFLARTMLASYFVADGVKAVRDPGASAGELRPVAERVVPLVKSAAPPQVASLIPSQPRTLARLTGIAQVIGGISLATGIGRRMGAIILAATLVPQVIAASPLGGRSTDDDDEEQRGRDFVVSLSLLGATLLASGDTQGRPSLGWRADHVRRDLAKSADKHLNRVEKTAEKKLDGLDKKARRAAKKARRSAKKAKSDLNL